jgi:hypothetical protein
MNDSSHLTPLEELERRLCRLLQDTRRTLERSRQVTEECRRVNAACRAARHDWQASLDRMRRDRTKRDAARAARR